MQLKLRSRHVVAGVLVAGACTAAPLRASADPPTARSITVTQADVPDEPTTPGGEDAVDTVTLDDGTELRGYVSELQPQRAITFVLLDGSRRRIAWERIHAATGPSFAPPPGAAPGTLPGPVHVHIVVRGPVPAPAAAPVPALEDENFLAPAPGRARLVVDSVSRAQSVGIVTDPLATRTGPVVLSADGMPHTTSSSLVVAPSHRDLCFTPCTLFVRPGVARLLTSAGGGVGTVTAVEVPTDGLKLVLRPVGNGAQIGGAMLVTFGTLGGLTGVLLLAGAIGAIGSTEADRAQAPGFAIGGGITTAASVGLFILGMHLIGRGQPGVENSQHLGDALATRGLSSLALAVGGAPGGGAMVGASLRF